MVVEWYVADDAETDERYAVDVASLCDGAALHVDGFGFGEVVEYLLHLVTAVDKPLAAHGESAVDGRSAVDGQSLGHKCFGRREAFGHAEYLSVGTFCSAVSIVVGAGGADAYFANVERGVGATGYSCRNDEVGMVGIYQFYGSDGGVYLADTTLCGDDGLVGNLSEGEGVAVVGLGGGFGEQCAELGELLVHGDDNADDGYFLVCHICESVGGVYQ